MSSSHISLFLAIIFPWIVNNPVGPLSGIFYPHPPDWIRALVQIMVYSWSTSCIFLIIMGLFNCRGCEDLQKLAKIYVFLIRTHQTNLQNRKFSAKCSIFSKILQNTPGFALPCWVTLPCWKHWEGNFPLSWAVWNKIHSWKSMTRVKFDALRATFTISRMFALKCTIFRKYYWHLPPTFANACFAKHHYVCLNTQCQLWSGDEAFAEQHPQGQEMTWHSNWISPNCLQLFLC